MFMGLCPFRTYRGLIKFKKDCTNFRDNPEVRYFSASSASGIIKFCQQCKFLHKQHILCVLITKTVEIRRNLRCKIFGPKIWRCNFF